MIFQSCKSRYNSVNKKANLKIQGKEKKNNGDLAKITSLFCINFKLRIYALRKGPYEIY